MQGLDGKYTQILKDSFPDYQDAASGLGLLQVSPLDLKQVEIIKGSISTLHTDTRQTRFGSIYTGPITSPTFKPVYAPLDGFVANAGIKIRLNTR